MIIHTLVCDRCGKEIVKLTGINYSGPHRVELETGPRPTAEADALIDHIDLCGGCLGVALTELLRKREIPHAEAKAWLAKHRKASG